MSIITVIGSGAMGSAMSFPARENGHAIRLVGTMLDREIIDHAGKTNYHLNLKRTLPDGVEFYQLEELSRALEGADLIISGVSSFGVNWFADEVIPLLPAEIPVLSVTKGMFNLEDGSLISCPGLYSQKAPGRSFCAVGGPCTSYDLADRDQTHVCFCGGNIDELRAMKEMLETYYYNISLTTDVEGLECAVAMKNAYAMAVTLAVGVSLKDGGVEHFNSQAALFSQSVKEMLKLLSLNGFGSDSIVFGAGDLYVTIKGGRNRKLGILLGQGHSFESAMEELSGVTVESISIIDSAETAVRAFIKAGKADEKDFPLLLHLHEIIKHGAKADIPWKAFASDQ